MKYETEVSGPVFAGDPELVRLAFDCGIGSKNSQGFGMIERTDDERFQSG